MFEHVRNYEELLRRIAGWLKPGGKLMVHIFCHARFAYPFETEGASNWMGRHFFTGGIMPSDDLLLHFQRDLVLEDRWRFSGTHYARTLEAWLANATASGRICCVCSSRHSGEGRRPSAAAVAHVLHGLRGAVRLRGGNEWFVSHYLFRLARARILVGHPDTSHGAAGSVTLR